MELLDKKMITDRLGKFNMWKVSTNNSIVCENKYLGGIPPFDNLLEGDDVVPGVMFFMRPNGLEVVFMHKSNEYKVAILKEQITQWTIEQGQEISGRKSKSIIGRALIGGVLLGPVGAIVGGMTGIGDKPTSQGYENFISVIYSNEDEETTFFFSCREKDVKDVQNFFSINFTDKYVKPDEMKIADLKATVSSGNSVADELFKLKALMDEGLLSKEEFETQKARLLNS